MNSEIIQVFPLEDVWGLSPGWFQKAAATLEKPSFLLIALFLIISIGIMVLKRFENTDLESKLWNIPIIILLVLYWPHLIEQLKFLIDGFNTFLIRDVFQMTWEGQFSVSFKDIDETKAAAEGFSFWKASTWGEQLLNQGVIFILLLSRNIIYAFYIVFFFFFAVLGPFILAKGILTDEIQSFLEIVKQIVILFLWQTTYVILVGFIYPQAGSSGYLLESPEPAKIGWVLVLAILTLFIPTLTSKFGNHLGSSFVPPGFRWGGLALGASVLGKVAFAGAGALGLRFSDSLRHRLGYARHRALVGEEFIGRWRHQSHNRHLELEMKHLKSEHPRGDHEGSKHHFNIENHSDHGEPHSVQESSSENSVEARHEHKESVFSHSKTPSVFNADESSTGNSETEAGFDSEASVESNQKNEIAPWKLWKKAHEEWKTDSKHRGEE